MSLHQHAEIIERIHVLVLRKGTGTPGELSHRLGISVRTLYRILAELREEGAFIKYDAVRGSYVYENEVAIRLMQIKVDRGERE